MFSCLDVDFLIFSFLCMSLDGSIAFFEPDSYSKHIKNARNTTPNASSYIHVGLKMPSHTFLVSPFLICGLCILASSIGGTLDPVIAEDFCVLPFSCLF